MKMEPPFAADATAVVAPVKSPASQRCQPPRPFHLFLSWSGFDHPKPQRPSNREWVHASLGTRLATVQRHRSTAPLSRFRRSPRSKVKGVQAYGGSVYGLPR
ncbi:hypothetical protein V6N11_066310 [Hibiscus sabdariffa]|uniref:Uncharacterized protein n=1 Tax=Hibiscus sabdariffa TaxID=183260 RepID=A0ABR2A9S1_9ROSI